MTAPVLLTTLTSDERDMIGRLNTKLHQLHLRDKLNDAYYEGDQRLKQIGIAVPPELQMFELVVNWPRTYVDEVARRQNVKSLILTSRDTSAGANKAENEALQEGFEANNLESEIPMLNRETMIFGRCYMTVGSNEDDAEHPLISVESPTQMSSLINQRRRRMDAAFRQYREEDGTRVGTLFLPDKTIQVSAGPKGWVVDDVDEHGLGRVPVVLFLNRRRLGKWQGVSEMKDVIPLTDGAARALTNLQIALETHSVPQKWVMGMSKGDFVDKDGNPIPVWQSYYTAIWANQAPPDKVKVGQFTASDLKNFHDTTNHYASLASSVTGLPFRYFGQNTANPAAEGAIRADESRLIQNAEEKNRHVGVGLSWAMALYERFRTGNDLDPGKRITVEWRNAGTPTKAEEADAIQKLNGGTPVYSREGSWDELGWTDARKDRERKYFAQEASAAPTVITPPELGSGPAPEVVPA